MKTIKISLSAKASEFTYNICLGNGILNNISNVCEFEKFSSVALLIDENIKETVWLKKFQKSLTDNDIIATCIYLPAGEKSKSISTMQEIWTYFQKAGMDRKSLSVSLGGGAICDINGFASSTYMRGINLIHIPTTLLSQVDASIGGKTGINFGDIKNLVGTFNQPKAVIIDIETLSSLPDREFNSGYAEIIKHGLIADEKYFNKVRIPLEDKRNPEFLEEVISGSCTIKAAIVESDPEESGLRKILNFGHTFGHAIESLSHQLSKPYLHGEAIGIGLVAEAKLSEYLGNITHKQVLEVEESLTNYNLPIRLDFKVDYEDIIGKIKSDKKNAGSKVNWSLLQKIGKANYDQTISQDQIKEALQYISHAG